MASRLRMLLAGTSRDPGDVPLYITGSPAERSRSANLRLGRAFTEPSRSFRPRTVSAVSNPVLKPVTAADQMPARTGEPQTAVSLELHGNTGHDVPCLVYDRHRLTIAQ